MKKELLDVFRDKKTVIMMLVVPIILYPLIFVGAMMFTSAISSSMETQDYRIAVKAEDDGAFMRKIQEAGTAKGNGDGDGTEEAESVYTLTLVDADSVKDYEDALNQEEIDVYVTGRMEGDKMQYDVYYLSSVTNSDYAMNIVMKLFDEFSRTLTEEKIREAGLDVHAVLEPVSYERKDTASNEQSLGNILGSILPFMLVISLLMGTMYPAIDTTAGERERGTLETILTLPVTNRQLIVAKFLTVASIGILSAFLNILSMGGIVFYIFQLMETGEDAPVFELSRFLPAILVCILSVLAFSLLISAVTMCVTAFARSYKEANNYITPLMLVVMFIGYIGFIPNVEMTQTMAMMPVANICLLIKNMLVFKIDYTVIAVVLLSNVAYAVFAILFLSKIYNSEAILFGDSKGSLQLFERRDNLKKGGVPAISDVWFVVALTTVLILYVGSILQVKFGLAGVFATQMILLLVPLAVVLYTKKDIRETYGLKKTGLKSYLGAFFTITGFFCINILLSTGLVSLFPDSTDNIVTTFSSIMGGSAAGAFFVIAIAPAVCEEMLFRGMIFHSMKARYRVSTAILAVAALFGIYHMSLVKFLPTGLLGLVICYVVYRTGSIFPGMLMHFINNAISVLLFYYPDQIGRVVPALTKETLAVSDVLCLLGIGIILIVIGQTVLHKKARPGR